MSTSLFNEALLTASVIAQGKAKFEEMWNKKTQEWMPKISEKHRQYFILAMMTYSELAEEAASSGNPEAIVALVEQFRAYEPMFTSREFALFDAELFNFHRKLVEVSHSTYLSDQEKYAKISKPFIDKAKQYIKIMPSIRTLLDKKALEGLITDWNKAAKQWKKVVDEVFPEFNTPTTQSS